MIAYLKGQPRVIGDTLCLVVNNVGYGVEVSQRVLLTAQQQTHSELELFIYTHVREDQLQLFGFLSTEAKRLFELMLGVSGVGPSTALHLVDKDPDSLITAVQEADVAFFKAVPRVGKKLAQKIIIELSGKLGELKELQLTPMTGPAQAVAEALESLGFDPDQARTTVEQLDLENMTESEAIKAAIKHLGSK